MSAISPDHTDLALPVSKQDQIFAEYANERWLRLKMCRNTDGPPVTAEKFSHRRSPAGPSEDFIFFLAGLVHQRLLFLTTGNKHRKVGAGFKPTPTIIRSL